MKYRWPMLVVLPLLLLVPLLLLRARGGVTPRPAGVAQGSEAPAAYFPIVARNFAIDLELMGSVAQPTDVIATEHGLLASENLGRVVKPTDGQIFLDLSDRADVPRFESIAYRDGYLYGLYTILGADAFTQQLSRFPVAEGKADAAAEERLLTAPGPTDGRHFGSDLNFGPDGYLYVTLGDADAQGDPRGHAQSTQILFGSILRLDVDGGGQPADCDPAGGYTIPAGNPFADGAGGNCDELWAIGVRQPWRASFDRETGDFWITDVGLEGHEEINFQPASSRGGENYGWNCYEGSEPFGDNVCEGSFVFPHVEYQHTDGRCAVTGGYVYRGEAMPLLEGLYIFADYCSGEISALDANRSVRMLTRRAGAGWATFGEGLDGELYIADNTSGAIYKLTPYSGD